MNLDENYKKWATYNWRSGGSEWSGPWGSVLGQWLYTVYPRIVRFMPTSCIMEIACGAGRWSKLLHQFATRELILVDMVPEVIQLCSKTLGSYDRVTLLVNDGKTLTMVEDNSVGFAFSFDALVHVEMDVMESYIHELAQKLDERGVAFLHHSNALDATEHDSPSQDHLRASSVGHKKVAEVAKACGLGVYSQEIVSWGYCADIDCFTTLVKGRKPLTRVWQTSLKSEHELSKAWTQRAK